MPPTWRERDLLQLRLDLLNVLADRLRDDGEVLMQRAVGWAGARGLLGSHGAVAEAAQLGAARPVAQAAGLLALWLKQGPSLPVGKVALGAQQVVACTKPHLPIVQFPTAHPPLVMLPRLRIRPHGMQQTPKHPPPVNKSPMQAHLLVMLPRLRIKSARRAHIWSATLPPARTLRRCATFSLQGEAGSAEQRRSVTGIGGFGQADRSTLQTCVASHSAQPRHTCLQDGTKHLPSCPCIPQSRAHRSRRRSYMRVSAAQRCTWSTPSSASSLAAWMAQSKYDLRQGRAGRVVRHGECSRAETLTAHAGRSVHACGGMVGPDGPHTQPAWPDGLPNSARALHARMHLPCPPQQVHGGESKHIGRDTRHAGRHAARRSSSCSSMSLLLLQPPQMEATCQKYGQAPNSVKTFT